jgi:hypothetical protein
MDREELATLRAEVEAAWEEVKRTSEAQRTDPTPRTRAEATLAFHHWNNAFNTLYAEIKEGLRLDPATKLSLEQMVRTLDAARQRR